MRLPRIVQSLCCSLMILVQLLMIWNLISLWLHLNDWTRSLRRQSLWRAWSHPYLWRVSSLAARWAFCTDSVAVDSELKLSDEWPCFETRACVVSIQMIKRVLRSKCTDGPQIKSICLSRLKLNSIPSRSFEFRKERVNNINLWARWQIRSADTLKTRDVSNRAL